MNENTLSIISDNKQQILSNWMKLQLLSTDRESSLFSRETLNDQSSRLLSALVQNLMYEDTQHGRAERKQAMDEELMDVSFHWTKLGLTPRDTSDFIFNLKYALLQSLQEKIRDPQLLHFESQKVGKMMDSIGITMLESSIQSREIQILRQTSEINDIKTPIIELWQGILILPIIGTLDSSRTEAVMDELLARVSKDDIQVSIVDISGVPAIDSSVAQHLIKLVTAVRLLGADCIISGIRPEIAQTIVHLGIDLGRIITKATLADALRISFAKKGLQVARS